MTPIFLICGEKNAGKDTVASYLQTYLKNTALIAQADPIKRFAKQVFEFTDDQLWGPSDNRNEPDERYSYDNPNWDGARHQLQTYGGDWLTSLGLGAGLAINVRADIEERLINWFEGLRAYHRHRQLTLSPRTILQNLGTDFARKISPTIWNDTALAAAQKLLGGGYAYERSVGLHLTEMPDRIDNVVVTDGRFKNEILAVKLAGGFTIKVANPNPGILEETQHQSEAELATIPRRWFDVVLENDKRAGLLSLENAVATMVRELPYPRVYVSKPPVTERFYE